MKMKNRWIKGLLSLSLACSVTCMALGEGLFPVEEGFVSEEVYVSNGEGGVTLVGDDWDGNEGGGQMAGAPQEGWEVFGGVSPTPMPAPTATPRPKRTPMPTATPVPTATPTPKPAKTKAPDPTPTAVPGPGTSQQGSLVEMELEEDDRVPMTGVVSMGEFFGFTRQEVVSYLEKNQRSYLGTPYVHQGEPVPGKQMQCTGFVWTVLDACLRQNRSLLPCSDVNTGRAGRAPTWAAFFEEVSREGGSILYYDFDSRESLLSSGLVQKGDLIWSYTDDPSRENHVGFFWGKDGSEDLYWNSSAYYNSETVLPKGDYRAFVPMTYYGEQGINRISHLEACTTDDHVEVWRLIPLDRPAEPKKGWFDSLVDFLFGWL